MTKNILNVVNDNAVNNKVIIQMSLVSKLIIFIVVAIITIVYFSVYSINEGERGVLLNNGRISGIESSGLHFKIPGFQSIVVIPVRQVTSTLKDVELYSYDQQTASMDISITWGYDVSKIKEIYTEYGLDLPDIIIRPRMNNISKTVFGKFSAAKAIQNRQELVSELEKQVKSDLKDFPINILSVQIENINFSTSYEKAIEDAVRAKAQVEKAKSDLARFEQEAQQKVVIAKAEALAQKERADADAYAVRVKSKVEAEALRMKGDALREAPALVYLKAAEKWNGVLPTTMVPGSTLPFINVKN